MTPSRACSRVRERARERVEGGGRERKGQRVRAEGPRAATLALAWFPRRPPTLALALRLALSLTLSLSLSLTLSL